MEQVIVYALLLLGCWFASEALFVEEEVFGG